MAWRWSQRPYPISTLFKAWHPHTAPLKIQSLSSGKSRVCDNRLLFILHRATARPCGVWRSVDVLTVGCVQLEKHIGSGPDLVPPLRTAWKSLI